MPELRQDPLSGRLVLLAPERRDRPDEYRRPRLRAPDHLICPFCPGNERETPPETSAIRPLATPADGPGWTVRVVPNRYPAIAADDGVHELVIESDRHDTDLGTMPAGEAERTIGVWRDRLRALRARPGIRSVVLFRNQGAESGATHRHPHSQLLASRIVPDAIAREAGRMRAHAAAAGRCLVCDLVEREIAAGTRVVRATERFAVLAPCAPRVPYELLIVPRAHRTTFALADDAELGALAAVLGDALGRLARRLDDPPFNLALHDAPVEPAPPPLGYHWHLEVVPRIGTTGGFEWGADSFINTTPPEEAAAELRSG